MTDEARNIHQRIAAAMGNVSYIQKEEKKGMQYRIVSHDAVTALVRPALLKEGVIYYPVKTTRTQVGNRTEADMTIRFVNIDAPTDYIEVETFGYGIDPQDKGPGKAMSYAVKYALLKTLGLETGDDPDLDQNTKFDPRDNELTAYVAKAKTAILNYDTREDLIAYWKATEEGRKTLRLKPGVPEYDALYAAYKAHGLALSQPMKEAAE